MITFSKMHGLGNDYVFVDCTKNKNYISNPSKFSQIISNRNFGIGSDGLILIEDSTIADFKMRIFNSDGSEAEMCGNGIRCTAKYIYSKKLSRKLNFKIETLAGIKDVSLILKNNVVSSIKVKIGKAIIYPDISLEIKDKKFNITPVTIGNPHAVIFLNNIYDINFDLYAPLIESHSYFKNKTNVEFVQVINQSLVNVLVWERGSGKTLACGTGASAVSAVAFYKKFIFPSAKVNLPGGVLQTYVDNSLNVSISGPATLVYDGIYYGLEV